MKHNSLLARLKPHALNHPTPLFLNGRSKAAKREFFSYSTTLERLGWGFAYFKADSYLPDSCSFRNCNANRVAAGTGRPRV